MKKTNKNVAFRVDASCRIGTGHFMRCLALADGLRRIGARTRFVSRYLPEYLYVKLSENGHEFAFLDAEQEVEPVDELAHAAWLGVSQRQDASATLQALSDRRWDWLVVDHYALDRRWESLLRQAAKHIMAIDDVADRKHDCDVLLDQNQYEALGTRYVGLVPNQCQLLLGARFALLRNEFRVLHEMVQIRRGPVKRILIFFGGVDAENYTGLSLRALAEAGIGNIQVDVVVGAQHPFRKAIESACAQYGYSCHVQTAHMAELMAAADLAIGAAGSTSWERCCLALPAIAFSMADNQIEIAKGIEQLGVGWYLQAKAADLEETLRAVLCELINDRQRLSTCSRRGYSLVDGRGVDRVCACLSA